MATQNGGGGFIPGLLGSIQPWLLGGAPSSLDQANAQYGGMNGLMSAFLQDSPGSQGAAAMGRAMQGIQDDALSRAAARQSLASGNIDLQKKAMLLPYLNAYYKAAANAAMNGQQPPQGPPGISGPGASTATPQAPVVGGFSPRPQSAQGAAPQSASDPFAVPTPDQIASLSVGGMSPAMQTWGGILNGMSPMDIAAKLRQQQLAIERQNYGAQLGQLDTIVKGQSPHQYVAANPQLQAKWRQLAPQLGFDPVKDFNDANVRTAFGTLRNQISGVLGLPTSAPPVQVRQFRGPLNSLYTEDPVTHEIKQVRGEEGLKQVVDGNGNVSYVPASQAPGKTPFNAETYINPQTTEGVAKLIADYKYPADKLAYAMRTPQGQAIMAQVQKLNPNFDASTYAVKQQAREKFATGKQGDIVRSLSVATNHLDQLSDAAHALAQNNTPAINHVVNAFSTAIGNPSVTSFDAMKEIVGDEVVKAVVGTSGAESDRQAIKDAFKAANSPQQLEGVIQKYEGLMGGQLSGLRRQYERSTGLHDFNDFVSDLAKQKLDGGSAPTALNVGQSATVGQFKVTRVR